MLPDTPTHSKTPLLKGNNPSSWLWQITLIIPLVLWSYWSTLTAMANKWLNDPQYSQGYLVPVFAVYILYLRRNAIKDVSIKLDPRGLLLILGGLVIHIACGYFNNDWMDGFSLVPVLSGLFWLFGGWQIFCWSLPAIFFLIFMLPLPYRIETGLAYPLQRIATLGSEYLLQTLGVSAVSEGNVILLSRSRIGVVEACSGLSMLLIFFALAAAVIIIYQPPWLERIVLILSAIPIAVVVNIIRITATAVAQESFGEDIAQRIFHDWAGWLMMPIALAFLALELWFLKLMLPLEQVQPVTQTHIGATGIKAIRKNIEAKKK